MVETIEDVVGVSIVVAELIALLRSVNSKVEDDAVLVLAIRLVRANLGSLAHVSLGESEGVRYFT